MKKYSPEFIKLIRLRANEFLYKLYAVQRKKFSKDEWLFYATKTIDEHLELSRDRFIKTTKFILLFTVVLFFIATVFSFFPESLEKQLAREPYGGKIKNVEVEVEANYEKTLINQKIQLSVLPQTLSLEEEEIRIEDCIAFLRKNMLGENKGFLRVTEDLNLIEYDEVNDVFIAWKSSKPQYVNDRGCVNFLTLKQNERVTLIANLSIGSSKKQHSFTVHLDPLSKMDFTDNIRQNVVALAGDLSKDTEGTSLRLPLRNKEGVFLKWSSGERTSIPLFLIPLSFALIGFLYFVGEDFLKKTSKQRKVAIEEELPNLALQLILLLNAGLVVHAAFKEILFQNKESEHPLYEILEKLSSQCAQTNESFVQSFYSFSQRSGNRNLIRFMTLVSDHGIRGSELAEKLQRERELLWESRLQRAKGKAKEAETKLCLPLMLLLLVLVVISISPALLEL